MTSIQNDYSKSAMFSLCINSLMNAVLLQNFPEGKKPATRPCNLKSASTPNPQCATNFKPNIPTCR